MTEVAEAAYCMRVVTASPLLLALSRGPWRAVVEGSNEPNKEKEKVQGSQTQPVLVDLNQRMAKYGGSVVRK
jgi:hypothetical protein